MGEDEKEGPVSNIKEYIVNGRKNGFSDAIIIENLKKTNWPDDVIKSAMVEADKVIPAVTEEEKTEETSSSESQSPSDSKKPGEEKKEEKSKEEKPKEDKKEEEPKKEDGEEKKEEPTSDLLTKPPKDVFPEKDKPKTEEHIKKKFSILSLIALLFSPIPFIGLGVAMAAIDHNRKKHKSGTIFAILALIINVIVILTIVYVMYQLFLLPSENLVGLSKLANEWFNIV